MVNLRLDHYLHAAHHLVQQLIVVETHLFIEFLIVTRRDLQRLRLLPEQRRHSTCYFPEHPPAVFRFGLSFSQFALELVLPRDQGLHVVNPVLFVGEMAGHECVDVLFLLDAELRMLGYQRRNLFVCFSQLGEALLLTELAGLLGHQLENSRQLRIAARNAVIETLNLPEDVFSTSINKQLLFEVLGGLV